MTDFSATEGENFGALFIVMNFLPKRANFLLIFVGYYFIMVSYWARRRLALGELIGILSGKGGTGKTSVCAGLATALAEQKKKVLCIDCDIGLRNLDISLGLTEEGALSFQDVCHGGYDLEQAAVHPIYPTLRFLTAPMNCGPEEIDPTAFAAMLRAARDQFDYIFLDAPAGVDDGFRLAARSADRIILVTGPDPAAVRDAARSGELLELMGKDNIRLIINRINKKIVHTLELTVDDIMDAAGLPLLGVVPEDKEVVFSAFYGEPLLKSNRRGAAAAFRRIAKRIQGMKVPVTL